MTACYDPVLFTNKITCYNKLQKIRIFWQILNHQHNYQTSFHHIYILLQKAPHGQRYFMLNIHIYFKWSSFIYKWLYNDAESNTYIWISMFTVISMANNCLVRAIFHPPTHPPPPWSTSVYHTILRQDLDIISYCFRNEYLRISKFSQHPS